MKTDRVEAGIRDGLKVGKRDPRIPMLLEDITSIRHLLAKRVLINDALLSLKYGRSDPSSILHSVSRCCKMVMYTHGSSTSHPPILIPRTFSEPKLKPICLFWKGELR